MKVSAVDSMQQVSREQSMQRRQNKLQHNEKNFTGPEPIENGNMETVPVNEEQVIKAIEEANKSLALTQTSFEFSIHEETKEIMVRVLNKETGEVIREIPPEKILDMIAQMWELAGLLVDEKV
ncbi:MAG: flagellar protein FlaG [Clostridia bacterium]|jgi:flagellar protein FlaG|nr:flagellar protein FlaG [Clostridiales bacterium]MDK2986227.1 flagellar protein FlaG [Clostridia bacterium]